MATPESCRSTSLLILDTFNEGKFEQAVAEGFQRLGGPADLVFAFVSPDWIPHLAAFNEVVQIGLRCARVVGCTADGIVGESGEHEGISGCSLIALRLPGTRISIEKWSGVKEAAPDTPAANDGVGAVILGNPLRLPVEVFLERWQKVHPGIPAFGGLASGGTEPEGIILFTENGIAEHTALAVHFAGGIRMDGALGQGCRIIGDPWVISEVKGNVIKSLAGLPPLQCLERSLEEATRLEGHPPAVGPGMLHVGLSVAPDGLPAFSPLDDMAVRAIIHADEDDGSIALAGSPRVGQTLHFCLRDSDAASVWWQQAVSMTQERQSSLPVAGLLFPCLGRGTSFFGIPDHDISTIQENFGAMPAAGFFTNGELINHPHRLQAHSFAVVGAFFYPAGSQQG